MRLVILLCLYQVTKKIESIQNYTNRTSDSKKRKMSEDLASAIVKSKPKVAKVAKHEVSTTVSKPVEQSKNIVELPQEKAEFSTIDQVQLKDLIQISPEEEKNLMRELFDIPFEPQNVTNVVTSNVQEHRPNLA